MSVETTPLYEEALTAGCQQLVARVGGGQQSLAEALIEARYLVAQYPSVHVVAQLQEDGARERWRLPAQALVQVALAEVMAHTLVEMNRADAIPILAACQLTHGLILSLLGRLGEALALLERATESLLAQGQVGATVRALSEAAIVSCVQANFDRVRDFLDQARSLLAETDDPLAQPLQAWAEGVFHQAQSRHQEAAPLLIHAADTLAGTAAWGEGLLARCEAVLALRPIQRQEAQGQLRLLTEMASLAEYGPLQARSEHVAALMCDLSNHYRESLRLYQSALARYQQAGMVCFAAQCALDQGIAHYQLGSYEEARECLQQARTSFASQGLHSYVAICDLNLANIAYITNRYHEALAVYERVAAAARVEGRLLRVAYCYGNMGLCYYQLGRYDRALTLYQQTHQAFVDAGRPIDVAKSHQHIGNAARVLGRHAEALDAYQRAHSFFVQERLALLAARCATEMADLYLALDQVAEAEACLQEALGACEAEQQVVHQAACQRLLAKVAQRRGDTAQGLALLAQARMVFEAQGMVVETALCDLEEGELCLAQGEATAATGLFERALAVLSPGFPDHAWRAEIGLGQCALARHARHTARDHYMRAATLVGKARETLPTERLSSDFFTGRQHVFRQAIALALETGQHEQALRLVEASKARALLAGLPQRAGARPDFVENTYLAHLLTREADLRRQIQKLRNQLTVWEQGGEPPPAVRGAPATPLEALVALSQEYENVVEQLRLASRTVAPLSPQFSLAAFRLAAATHLGGAWLCVEYFLDGDQLTIFALGANQLRVVTKTLTRQDQRALDYCVSPDPERRERIYAESLQGFAAPGNRGSAYRQQLGQLLLPPDVLGSVPPQLLVIAPHGPLHGLPFHALLVGGELLLQHSAVLYTPSLQSLERLWALGVRGADPARALVCGVAEFGDRAEPLPHTRSEVETVAEAFGPQAELRYGPAVTGAALKQLSAEGHLAQYTWLHLTTHGIADPVAPFLSHLLLADGEMTVLDILELRLAARLVTLSACHAAVGVVRPGDEMMALARAFLVAGTQTVVASLWAVEDETTAVLMGHFYRHLRRGASIPEALRQAQATMHAQGYTPYQWAPFLAIGLP